MKRVLTVIESDLPALQFSIYAEFPDPGELGTRGYIRTEDPEDGSVSYLRQIGLYDSNEEAKRAADRYAAERGRVMLDWHINRQSTHRGTEPDLWANAMPREGEAPQ
jgi:hypothetical protein